MLKRWWWLSALVIALDQATKLLAETLLEMHQPVPVLPSFNLTLTYNTGAAFSFLADAGGWQRWFFLGLGMAVSIGLIAWLWRLKPAEKRLALAAHIAAHHSFDCRAERILAVAAALREKRGTASTSRQGG